MEIPKFFTIIIFYSSLRRLAAYPFDFQDSGEEEEASPTAVMVQMAHNLDKIPLGKFSIRTINLAYNDIQALPPYVFYTNLYKYLETIDLRHNRISEVSLEAFKELRQLKTVSLASNNLTCLEPNTFRQNRELTKVDLAYNRLSLDPEKAFLRSISLQTVILSNNNITHVFDVTFARLQNLRTLFLDNNPVFYLSSNCFVHLRRLQYVNIANTGVYRLRDSMFRTVPVLTDLTDTPLAKKFEPPLKKVKSLQLQKLMHLEKYILEHEDDVDT